MSNSRIGVSVCLIGMLICLSGCGAMRGGEPVNYSELYRIQQGGTVWVSQELTGGRQCDNVVERPPDTVRLLLDHGIAVFDFYSDGPDWNCLACDCPDYIVRHHVLIEDSAVPLVAELGYMPEETH